MSLQPNAISGSSVRRPPSGQAPGKPARPARSNPGTYSVQDAEAPPSATPSPAPVVIVAMPPADDNPFWKALQGIGSAMGGLGAAVAQVVGATLQLTGGAVVAMGAVARVLQVGSLMGEPGLTERAGAALGALGSFLSDGGRAAGPQAPSGPAIAAPGGVPAPAPVAGASGPAQAPVNAVPLPVTPDNAPAIERSNNRLARHLFDQHVGRAPSDEEAQALTTRLTRGDSAHDLASDLFNSDEATIARAFQRSVGQPIDPAGRTTWLARARETGDVAVAVRELEAYARRLRDAGGPTFPINAANHRVVEVVEA